MVKVSSNHIKLFILLKLLFLVLLLISSLSVMAQLIFNDLNIQPAKWKNNKTAAISFTFDDGYYCHFTKALTLLSKRNYTGTFFLITAKVDRGEGGVTWDMVRHAASLGNEIGSHTVNHVDLSKLANDKKIDTILYAEIINSLFDINKEVPSQQCLSFAYPWNNSNKIVDNILSEHYMCACKSGEYTNYITNYYGINRVTIDTKFKLNYLNNLIDKVINENTWMVESIHGIDSDGWHPIPYETYDQQFSYIKSRDSLIWVANVQDVVKYIKERQTFMVYDELITNKTITFKTTDFLPDDLYNYPITITMNLPVIFETVISAKQNNRTLPFKITTFGTKRTLLIDGIIPDAGKVTISVKRIPHMM
jgi:peptidoglycan/xylan/chitin deacetylase (PgdA/CDA1 family)